MFATKCEIDTLLRTEDKYNTKIVKDPLIQSLEKDLEWFMSESLRLDDICLGFKLEGDIWLAKADAFRDDIAFIETQVTETQRRVHVLEEALASAKIATVPKISPPVPTLPPLPTAAPAVARERLALRAELRALRSAEIRAQREQIELETTFLAAAREARKSLAQRKHLGLAESPVLDTLLASDEVLTKLYFSIFPHRRPKN